MSDKRIKPGVTISKEVWENFKKAYPENTSRKLEELMSKSLDVSYDIKYFSNSEDTKFTFEDAKSWNVSWQNSSMVVSNYSTGSSGEVIIKGDRKSGQIDNS